MSLSIKNGIFINPSPVLSESDALFLSARVLERCDPVLLEPCGEPEPDCAEAAGTVLFLTVSTWSLVQSFTEHLRSVVPNPNLFYQHYESCAVK